MLINVGLASLVIIITIAIHAMAMALAIQIFDLSIGRTRRDRIRGTKLTRMVRTSGVVLVMFFASLVEVLLWAIVYLGINVFDDLERALYFSIVTFTTLGYGDIVLEPRWQLLSGFEAANGIIMFGWTTSLVMAAVQRIYFHERYQEE